MTDQKPQAQKAQSQVVKNLHTGPLCVCGVNIAKGASAEVPNLDRRNAVIKQWIAKKVIAVQ